MDDSRLYELIALAREAGASKIAEEACPFTAKN